MALAIRSLATGVLSSEADLYIAPVNKAVIVRSIRLVNTGAAAQVDLFIRRGSSGTNRHIVAKSLSIGSGGAYLEDTELALEGLTAAGNSDRIRGTLVSGGPVDYVFSGIERDV